MTVKEYKSNLETDSGHLSSSGTEARSPSVGLSLNELTN